MHLSRALDIRCNRLAQLGRTQEFAEPVPIAMETADRGVQREPNNHFAVRHAEVQRIILARSAIEAFNAHGSAPLELALGWALEAWQLLQNRIERGWTTKHENTLYPTQYQKLIEDLREASDRKQT